ncbi:MAG: DUF167 domain-containing protein, partial [Acidimicrobiales bacterium]
MDVSDLYRAEGDDAAVLHVHVQPAAGRSAVVGRHGTSLKVRVAAAPEGGRANEAVAALLAETFGLKTADVELTSGATSRTKAFRLSGLDLEEFPRRLERAVAGDAAPGTKGAGRR